jgi:hypothetical protein
LRVFAWLKIERPDEQPPLRFGIEGRLNGQIYFRPATVGAKADSVSRPPLKDTWAWYCLQIEDLPASGLTDLRVVFHLAGKGEIWSDDVQVVDRWFERAKRKGRPPAPTEWPIWRWPSARNLAETNRLMPASIWSPISSRQFAENRAAMNCWPRNRCDDGR